MPLGILSLIASRWGIGAAVLAALAFGAFSLLGGSPGTSEQAAEVGAPSDERVQFISFVLDDVQKTWARQVRGYENAKLVVFDGATETACRRCRRAPCSPRSGPTARRLSARRPSARGSIQGTRRLATHKGCQESPRPSENRALG